MSIKKTTENIKGLFDVFTDGVEEQKSESVKEYNNKIVKEEKNKGVKEQKSKRSFMLDNEAISLLYEAKYKSNLNTDLSTIVNEAIKEYCSKRVKE